MARFVTGKTFGTTETVTAALLNQAVNDAAISTDSVDNSTIEVNSNALRLKDSSSKTTGVTFAKMQHISTAKVLGRASASEGDVEEAFDFKDEDDMSSNSATALASQQSIKAYVDAHGIVQRTRVASGTNLTVLGSSVIPLDDTLPQSNEGTQVLTTSFTPKSTSNRIEVSFNGLISQTDPSVGMVLALFEGSTCKAAKWFAQPSSGSLMSHITFQFTPSSTDAATYSLRIGNGAASGNPLYVNRQSNATATLGGLMEYSMTVLELKA